MESKAIHVAYARHHDTASAVAECIVALGQIEPVLLLVFCGGKHAPSVVLSVLRDAYGPVPVTGGSAAGAIARGKLGYSGLEIAVAAFEASDVVPRVHVNYDLLEGEAEAGEALARDVAASAEDGSVVLLLFDSVATNSPLLLHPASAIVDGFQAGLEQRRVTLIGGGLLTDINISDGWIFDGESVRRHAAVALVFPPIVRAETVVLHGCRPISTFMEITRIDGAVVYELDGEPALEVIERMLGLRLGGGLSLVATLGEKQGDPFAPYNENAYVNRLILGSDRKAGSIILFEPDFRVGTKVQIMSRDNALMLESARNGTAMIPARKPGREPFLALYIDCAGRASGASGAETEEAALVQRNFAPSVPLLGFYSGVEVAPFNGYSRPLDWTGVLTVLERQA